MMNEVWRDVVGYEGLYQVSNMGNVKSLNYRRAGKERILKQIFNASGYLQVGLYKDSKMKWHITHKLVAEAFIENPDNKPRICHINTLRADNRAENLCWASQKEILNNAAAKGRAGGRVAIKVFCDGTIYNSIAECAEHYGVNKNTMYKWLDRTSPIPSDFQEKGLDYYFPTVFNEK